MPVIGITGGIASGKSLFTRRLAARLGGALSVDSDVISRGMLEGNAEVLGLVRDRFGPGVFNAAGAVSRDALREIVFTDPAAKRDLEAILHPRVRREWQGWVERELQRAPQAALLVEIPLLYETGAETLFERVLLVACDAATQERRLRESRRLSNEAARRIIASQLPLSEKLRRADHVIWNDADSPAALDAQVELCARLLFPPSSPVAH